MQTVSIYDHHQLPDMRMHRAMLRITQLEAEIRRLTSKQEKVDRFFCVIQSNRIIRIAYDDILYVRAESNYSTIILENGVQYCLCRTLKSITDELPGELFLRCHRSFLVNKNYILEMDRSKSMIIAAHAEIPVSRRFLSFCSQQLFKQTVSNPKNKMCAVKMLHAG